jgi:hypothetical protein
MIVFSSIDFRGGESERSEKESLNDSCSLDGCSIIGNFNSWNSRSMQMPMEKAQLQKLRLRVMRALGF